MCLWFCSVCCSLALVLYGNWQIGLSEGWKRMDAYEEKAEKETSGEEIFTEYDCVSTLHSHCVLFNRF